MIIEKNKRDVLQALIDKNFTQDNALLKASWLDMPLGSMLVIADDKGLYLLEFVDRRGLGREIERLCKNTKSGIVLGTTNQILSIEHELKAYFDGTLKTFQTPYHLMGSPFQQRVWKALLDIPYGQTKSYSDQACALEKPSAWRAVANANGANQLALIIPCHRVIRSGGELGGYGAGVDRKKWLIDHEVRNLSN